MSHHGCRQRINDEIDPQAWKGREQEDTLDIPHVGEMLYRARGIQGKDYDQ